MEFVVDPRSTAVLLILNFRRAARKLSDILGGRALVVESPNHQPGRSQISFSRLFPELESGSALLGARKEIDRGPRRCVTLERQAEYRDSTSTIADHPPRRALALS